MLAAPARLVISHRHTLTQQFLERVAFEGISVLDLGSRHGENLHFVDKLVTSKKLVAVDFFNKTEGNVTFVHKDLEAPLDFADGEFDVVICNDVLEHLERKSMLLNEIARIAARYYVISLPNTQHYRYVRGLKRGSMGKQYVFNQPDGQDRHKWVTYYRQNVDFVMSSGHRMIESYDIVDKRRHTPGYRIFGPTAYTRNQLFIFEKHDHGGESPR